jgi:hypothetical protein
MDSHYTKGVKKSCIPPKLNYYQQFYDRIFNGADIVPTSEVRTVATSLCSEKESQSTNICVHEVHIQFHENR